MTSRLTRAARRHLLSARAHQASLAAYRAASHARLRAARLYALGAEVLGELSAAGRERWIRSTPADHALMSAPDHVVRLDAAFVRTRRGLAPAPDDSAWTDPPRLGPALPPDFPRFYRRL